MALPGAGALHADAANSPPRPYAITLTRGDPDGSFVPIAPANSRSARRTFPRQPRARRVRDPWNSPQLASRKLAVETIFHA